MEQRFEKDALSANALLIQQALGVVFVSYYDLVFVNCDPFD